MLFIIYLKPAYLKCVQGHNYVVCMCGKSYEKFDAT